MKRKGKDSNPLLGFKKLYPMEYQGKTYEIWQNKKKGALAFLLDGKPVQEESVLLALTNALLERNQEN